ncbi:hypothetical protein [Paucibacter sp. XJ19-41]|uniref:hypothetical protein n=1 Tax=Paucibacter sp. XJ19-41 TaxID=2927824 RepID=UPI00234BB424|nr:hypothetical protein [Paucibacter sp. XJ19-41]MDC6170662.1 hypothetical protein [Paucibacter sp. XJ19-41]
MQVMTPPFPSMTHHLELRFEPDTDGTGELFASARCENFSGAGSAWFHEWEVRAFGAKLQSCFPLLPGTELRLEGGYWDSSCSPTRLKDVVVGIRIYPVGITGEIGVRLELGDGTYERQRPESRGRASFELMATYEDIQRFGAQIQLLVQSTGGTASLYRNAA